MAKNLNTMSVQELEALKKTLQQQNMVVGAVGGVAGIVYANRTGGGFWRYVGYYILGAMVTGTLPRLFYFIPKENEVDAMINIKKSAPNPISVDTNSTQKASFIGDSDLEL